MSVICRPEPGDVLFDELGEIETGRKESGADGWLEGVEFDRIIDLFTARYPDVNGDVHASYCWGGMAKCGDQNVYSLDQG